MMENYDYTPYLQIHPQNHQKLQDYYVTLEIAKHLAMISGGEKAHEIRQYFIEIERAWNTPEQVMARALQVSNRVLEEYKQKLEYVKPKVEYYDKVLDTEDSFSITQIAKEVGMSGQALNKKLEELKVQYKQSNQWMLYAEYQDKGLTKTATAYYNNSKDKGCSKLYTKWTQKGREFILRKLGIVDENKNEKKLLN